jgi:DNA repair protein RadC
MADDKPDHIGHRKRLRERLLQRGDDALADYELIEMLLFAAKARGDTKPLAKALMKRFGSFGAVLMAEPEKLMAVDGMGVVSAAALKVVAESARRLAREEAGEAPIIASWTKLLAYCRVQLAHETVENFHVLFLDRRNRLIADERQQRGTIDHTPVYPREVVKRALELGASAVILVHNHPSGDPTPSKTDIEMTRAIQDAAEKLGIKVHDHVIIGRAGHSSFKAQGLLT